MKNLHARQSEQPLSKCSVSKPTPQNLKTLGGKETDTSSASVSDPLGGAGGQRVARPLLGQLLATY